MIRFNQLSKAYKGVTVLDIPELSLREGELVGLVGNNGAGKTTLMRLMLDLIKATSGDVTVGASVSVKTNPGKNSPDPIWTAVFLSNSIRRKSSLALWPSATAFRTTSSAPACSALKRS